MIDPGFFGGEFTGSRGYTGSPAADDEVTAYVPDDDPRELAEKLDRLSLVCMAMWSLFQDKTNMTEQDLLDRVRTLDLMDGVADGKPTKTVSRCRNCNRVMSPRHRRCLYCGQDKLIQSAFDAL